MSLRACEVFRDQITDCRVVPPRNDEIKNVVPPRNDEIKNVVPPRNDEVFRD